MNYSDIARRECMMNHSSNAIKIEDVEARVAELAVRAIDPLPRAPRRSSQVLLPKGRMSFFDYTGYADRVREWLECRLG